MRRLVLPLLVGLLAGAPAHADGLVAFYPMEGTVRDAACGGLDGVATGGSATPSGYEGGAWALDGVGDWVELPIDFGPDARPALTIGAWVNPDVADGIRQVLSHDDGGHDRTIGMCIAGTPPVQWTAFTGSGLLQSGIAPAIGSWTFLAAVYDYDPQSATGTVRLHVDGASFTAPHERDEGFAVARIGGNPGYGEFFDGRVDNVFVFDRALSIAEVDAIRLGGEAAIRTQASSLCDRRIPYAGRLAGIAGPLTLNVSLYDVEAGGTPVWGPEAHPVTPDASGHFAIVIGSSGLDSDADGIPDLGRIDADNLYVEIEVDDGMTQTTLSPRQALYPAVLARSAERVEPAGVGYAALAAEVRKKLWPTGSVVAWPGADTDIPEGWLLCDGQNHLIDDHPELAAVLLPIYGSIAPDTFRTPDYRGRFLRAVDAGSGRDPDAASRFDMYIVFSPPVLGDVVGSAQGSLTGWPATNPWWPNTTGAHTHYIERGTSTESRSQDAFLGQGATAIQDSACANCFTEYSAYGGSHTHSVYGGGDAESVPLNVSVHYIIKD